MGDLLSIVIATWQSGEHEIEQCLDSVFRHTEDVSFEVVVVDNASTDGTVERMRQRYEGIRVIANARTPASRAHATKGWPRRPETSLAAQPRHIRR